MILVRRISLIVTQIKTPNMKKAFHKIYCNLANLTRDATGETYAFVYTKPPSFSYEELRPFLEAPKLILTLIQTIDIGLKQRLMKNECILS